MSDDWLDNLDVVTPNDIMRAHHEALAAGGDRATLDAKLARLIQDAGSVEELAAEWTRQLRRERLMADFRAEIRRKSRRQQPAEEPPKTPSRRSTKPAQEPTAPAEQDAQAMLRELIRRFPDVARDVLGENGETQP